LMDGNPNADLIKKKKKLWYLNQGSDRVLEWTSTIVTWFGLLWIPKLVYTKEEYINRWGLTYTKSRGDSWY
jgi:hypothetical protein